MGKRGVHRDRKVVRQDKNNLLIFEGDKLVGRVQVHTWLHAGVPDSFTHFYGNGNETWVPPRRDLKRRLRGEGAYETGVMSSSARLFVGKLSVPVLGHVSGEYGRKLLGLPEPWNKEVSREDIEKAIRKNYPAGKILRYIAGDNISLPSKSEFWKGHHRELLAAWRRFGQKGQDNGLDKIMREMGPPYDQLPQVIHSITTSSPLVPRLRAQVARKFYSELSVQPITLKHSKHESDRKLAEEIKAHARSKRLSHYDPEETVAELLDIQAGDFSYSSNASSYSGHLGEEFIRLALIWSGLFKGFGVRFPYLGEEGKLRFDQPSLEIDYIRNSEPCKADGRKGNQAIEMKVRQQDMYKSTVDKLTDVYPPGKHNWKTGEPIESTLLVLDMQPHLYDLHLRRMCESGLTVVGFNAVHDCLSRVVRVLKKHRGDYLEGLRPRVDNLDAIVDTHRELVLNPSMLLAKPNIQRREWIYQAVRNIRIIGEQIYNEPGGEE